MARPTALWSAIGATAVTSPTADRGVVEGAKPDALDAVVIRQEDRRLRSYHSPVCGPPDEKPAGYSSRGDDRSHSSVRPVTCQSKIDSKVYLKPNII